MYINPVYRYIHVCIRYIYNIHTVYIYIYTYGRMSTIHTMRTMFIMYFLCIYIDHTCQPLPALPFFGF